MNNIRNLIARYDHPLPRYTSYPPVPIWTKDVNSSDLTYAPFDSALRRTAQGSAQGRLISLYIHLPFCRTRCTFCACNAIATSKTEIINRYIDAVILEMDIVRAKSRTINSLHLGGGTPTFLTEKQLEHLVCEIKKRFSFETDAEIGIEADPRQTTVEKIRLARNLGFNRISFGIQDTDPEVQAACGRIQDLEHIKNLIDAARETKYSSINVDICYGLPAQQPNGFKKTLGDVINLKPDRIALFNFAYVPWVQPHQRKIDPKVLPNAQDKVIMFMSAIELFSDAGYEFIGLDHFAKSDDELSHAQKSGTLRRTFQGYTTKQSESLIGMGATAISEIGNLYTQNDRKLISYLDAVENGRLPICRGYKLSHEDILRRSIIQKIFCEHKIDKNNECMMEINLDDLINDGLLEDNGLEFKVTPTGRLFLRNIAARFDTYLNKEDKKYSRAV